MKCVFLTEEQAGQIGEAVEANCFVHSRVESALLALLVPTEVPQDAMELVRHIEAILESAHYDCSEKLMTKAMAQAAALIDAFAKRVPRAMLEKAYLAGINKACFYPSELAKEYGVKLDGKSIVETPIAAKHNYTIKED